MHIANLIFWKYIRRIYSDYFNDSILEVGSYDVRGDIRTLFDECKEYIGVDWRPGPNVDIVTLVHEMKFSKQFKAIIAASLLEHDPYWEKSIRKMVEYIRPDGILVLSWGAARNPPHCHEHAPDGEFHPLKGDLVKYLLQELGLTIVLWIYEKNLYKIIGEDEWEYLCEYQGLMSKIDKTCPFPKYTYASFDGLGELGIVAFPSYKTSIYIDESLPEDRIGIDDRDHV